MGADNFSNKKKGPWSLEEGLELLKIICVATDGNFLKKRIKVHVQYQNNNGAESKKLPRYKIEDDDIYVYRKSVSIEEIIPLIIKKARCQKRIPNLTINWTTIASYMKTRSYDDLRNYWNLKLLPILLPN